MTVNDAAALRQMLAASAPTDALVAGPPSAATSQHLAGQVGAEVAEVLSSALARVELMVRSGRIGQHSLASLRDEITQARHVAMLAQQVSRLAAGGVAQAPESLDLPQTLRDALRQRASAMAARGIEVRQLLQPADVVVDASLLFSLLQNLLDWAFEHTRSQAITLSTGLNTWPVHALLHCDFAWRAPDRLAPDAELAFEAARTERGDQPFELDTMAWRLVAQAAQSMGVQISRQDTPWQVHLTLAFPGAPRRWPGLVDTLMALDDPDRMQAQPLAGCRVLVLATRPAVDRLVQEATAHLGLSIDVVGTLDEARSCALGLPPDVLVVDVRNSEVDCVLAELKAGGSGPALVQIGGGGGGAKGLEISTSGRFELLRVHGDAVMRDLPIALQYALNRGP